MANRRPSARRLKRLRPYNVREAAKAVGVTSATVRLWGKTGLESVESVYPNIYRGADLITFLKRREAKRKRPCGPGRLFCFVCKEPKAPAFDEVEFQPDGEMTGRLIGLCPDCASIMYRLTSRAKLHTSVGSLKVSIKCLESRLSETSNPNCNPHFEGD
jgi:hypothetical protein